MIREDWLQKSGFSASPKTLAEYVTLFNAIHAGDYNGDGKTDSWGITSEKDLRDLDGFMNPAFGIHATWLKDDQGKLINAQISPQERSKLEFYHSLYQKGLLSSQYITTNWELKEDEFYTGKVGVVSVSSPGNVGVYQKRCVRSILMPPSPCSTHPKARQVKGWRRQMFPWKRAALPCPRSRNIKRK